MKRFPYLILLVLLFLGLLVPVFYSHRAQPGKPEAQSKTAQTTSSSSVTQSEEKIQAEAQPDTASGRADSDEPQAKPKESQTPSQSKEQPTASEKPAAPEATAVVRVAVVGQDGKPLYGPAEVKLTKDNPWGNTALGALEATGLSYTVSSRFSGFVDSIAGQRNRGQSGWMYSVNGVTPSVAASENSVKQGDKVLWWYSTSIDQPPPSWDDLEKQR